MSAERWRTVPDAATNMIPAAIIQTAPRIGPGRAVNRARGEKSKVWGIPRLICDEPRALYHPTSMLKTAVAGGLDEARRSGLIGFSLRRGMTRVRAAVAAVPESRR